MNWSRPLSGCDTSERNNVVLIKGGPSHSARISRDESKYPNAGSSVGGQGGPSVVGSKTCAKIASRSTDCSTPVFDVVVDGAPSPMSKPATCTVEAVFASLRKAVSEDAR